MESNRVTKAEIAFLRSLAKKRVRDQEGLYIIEGPRLVEEALEAGQTFRYLFATEEFLHLPNSRQASPTEIERMSSLRTPQGVLGVLERAPRELPIELGEELTLVLDRVQDPGNLGTILRIADWFGIREVVCSPETADCYNPKVVQASMGALFRVNVSYAELQPLLESVAEGVDIYGTYLEGENIYEAELGNRGVIVMGSEGAGISAELESTINRKLYIPPFPAERPTVESLNVAVATAIICSEFRRR